jgi:hypothetical protein
MSISIPPAKNYSSPMVALSAIMRKDPVEGDQFIPIEIDWGTMGGPNNCVSLNTFALAQGTFSQIVALSIDNSACGSDLEFIFPDSSQTYRVPAYTPVAVFEVVTNQTQFYVQALDPSSADITRFAILNFLPPPIVLPVTQAPQSAAAFGAISATVAATTQIVSAGNDGRVEVLSIIANLNNGSSGSTAYKLQDGDGNILNEGQVYSQTGNNQNVICFQASSLDLPFYNGLQFVVQPGTGIASGSTFILNAAYRSA